LKIRRPVRIWCRRGGKVLHRLPGLSGSESKNSPYINGVSPYWWVAVQPRGIFKVAVVEGWLTLLSADSVIITNEHSRTELNTAHIKGNPVGAAKLSTHSPVSAYSKETASR